jgi:phosphoserine phosphatase
LDSAGGLARISNLIASHGMNIERIERLSRQLSPVESSANACVELLLSGESAREAAIYLLGVPDRDLQAH